MREYDSETEALRDAIIRHREMVMEGVDPRVANRELWLRVGDLALGVLS